MTARLENTSRRTDPMERELALTRLFDAPRELVFEAWTKVEHLRRWWGPDVFTNPVCEVDLRVGGAWRIVMRAPDGREYTGAGVYREIVPPERLVFTNNALDGEGNHLLEGHTTVLFEEYEGKTRLTLRTSARALVPDAARMLAGMEMGWSQSLDSLAEELAADREIVISRLFDAPRELVWKAWTDPAHLVQWWGPNGFTTTLEAMDVKPGGVWNFVMHGPDGTDFPNRCVFLEVVEPERIVYSQAVWKTTWTFEEEGKNTRLTIRMVFPSAEQRDLIARTYRAVEGGTQTLERLAGHLASI